MIHRNDIPPGTRFVDDFLYIDALGRLTNSRWQKYYIIGLGLERIHVQDQSFDTILPWIVIKPEYAEKDREEE